MNWILLVAFGTFVCNCVEAEYPGARVIFTPKALDYGNVSCHMHAYLCSSNSYS